jgi:hypothetical protein
MEKRLPRELRNTRVGVAQQRHEGAEPLKFVGFEADQDVFGHSGISLSLFGAAVENDSFS